MEFKKRESVSYVALDETVKIETDKGVFAVQLVDGEFRNDLGCLILSESDGEIDYEQFTDSEIDSLVEEAEIFASEFSNEFETDFETKFGEPIFIVENLAGYRIVVKNNRFINSDHSTYQLRYIPIADELYFSKEEALSELLEGKEN